MIALVSVELVIAVLALGTLTTRAQTGERVRVPASLWAALLLMGAATLLGGTPAAVMALKVALFASCVAYARFHPAAASRWLVLVMVTNLVLASASGSFGTKLGAVPLLLFAALFCVRGGVELRAQQLVLAGALVGETLQAALLGSRGGLLAVGLTVAIWMVPVRLAARGVALSAIALPVLYPVALTFALLSMLFGFELIEPTASNVERSVLASWCIDKIPEFLLPGPGGTAYFEDTSDIGELLMGTTLDAMVDPHNFLLSAWLWLGTLPMLALQGAWSALWWPLVRRAREPFAEDAKAHLVLAVLGLLTFTLSPPDTVSRLFVALVSGIALAGLRTASPAQARAPVAMPPVPPTLAARSLSMEQSS